MRTFTDQVSYYAGIVESAMKALSANPHNDLYREVSPNISGGYYFWDSGADRIFESPADLNEALLALELHKVLIYSVLNQLRAVVMAAKVQKGQLNLFGLPMDFGLLASTALKLAKRDPLTALKVKLALAEIAKHLRRPGLAQFLNNYCLLHDESSKVDEGEKICAAF